MSLSLVACDCGSSEQLMRQALHRYEYKNWAMEPIKKGKSASLAEVERLLRIFPNNQELLSLFAYIKNGSKWCIFIGYNKDGDVKWADIAHGKMKTDVEAELTVKNFA